MTRSGLLSSAPLICGVAAGLILVLVIAPPPLESNVQTGNASGYTYDQAAGHAVLKASSIAGGPWRLISVVGILTTQPLAPQPDIIPPAACQDLPGPTVWNASRIPVWAGPLNSGVAPFWEFLFINSTGAILAIQTVNQAVASEQPISPTTPCGAALSVIGGKAYSLNSSPTVSAPVDSPVAAGIAWDYGGKQLFTTQHQTAVYLGLGGPYPLFGIPWGPGWGVLYSTCGIGGFSGNAADVQFGIQNASGPSFVLAGNSTCTFGNYSLSFGAKTVSGATGGGVWVSFPISVNSPVVNNSSEIVSLNAWMTSLSVTNSSGGSVPAAPVSCTTGTSGPFTCSPTAPGWFAGLSTDRGYWLDLFCTINGTAGWTAPNVGVYTFDSIVVYLPPSLATASLTLSATSTLATTEIGGSTLF